ncbi:MAG TPA: ISL3 family transposase [Candidatus Dojkabacteria bacterium]|nr:ISL3 family transposase [Candidatus Dojkabacteria bacterium]
MKGDPTTMGKSITGILEIQGWWKITQVKEEKNQLHLYLLNLRKSADCPRCGKRTKTGYDTQPVRTILHTTIGSRLVFLHIAPRRFICSCVPDKPFREKLPGVSGARSTTERFDTELIQHLSGQAFSTVTGKLGLTYPSQRLRLTEAVDPLVPRWDLVSSLTEIHLGLDGHHVFNRRFVETITEVKQGIPLGILPNNRKLTIKAVLSSCPEEFKIRIKTATVDMDDGTIAAIRDVFPQALIVIDHFHVIQDANRRLDEARRIEQEAINFERGKQGKGKIEIPGQLMRKAREHLTPQETIRLAALLSRYPRLKVWYEYKERVREIYTSKDRQGAAERLHFLICLMQVSDDAELLLWGRNLKYYREEILNYFAYRTTNAYTEGLNVRCKLVQRISSGFRNVDVYIRKAMLVLLPLSVAVTGSVYINKYPLPLS